MNTADWPQAPPVFPCRDRWPHGTLTDYKRSLYAAQQAAGQICGLSIRWYGDIAIVEYLSACPHEWFLDGMRKAPEQITFDEVTK